MKQQNCHARSKRKRKMLRLKNFFKRVFRKRTEKIQKANLPKGHTIHGKAKDFAIDLRELFPNGGYGYLFSTGLKIPNQRQRRKLARQQPHGR